MSEKKKRKIMTYVLAITMVMTAAFGFYLSANAAEADPGAGKSGILEVFIIDHASRPANYALNISEGAAYTLGYGVDDFNIELPHSTTFDIVVKVRANASDAYDTAWNMSRLQCYLNATGALTISSANMSETQIGNNSTYVWVNYWLDNSGNGYTIGIDQTATIADIHFEYYG